MYPQHPPEGEFGLVELLNVLERVQRAVSEGLAGALAEDGMSVDRWRVLDLIDRHGGASMGELAEESGLPNATLSRAVDALEDESSVFRLPSPADRRRIEVRLTDQGRSRLARLRELVTVWEPGALEALGPGLDALAAAAEKLRVARRA